MRAQSASPPRMANDRPVSMKTKEYRKIVKPLLERRRRARINSCLNELRNFILDATKQDSVQASKLEKADILEMTVHYLRLLLRQQCVAATAASTRTDTAIDVGRFRAGFTECANEVSMFVATNMSNSAVNPQVRSCLLGHLSKCLSHLDRISSTEVSSMQLPPPPPPTSEASAAAVAKRLPPLPSGPPPPPPPPPYGPHQPEVFGRISSGRPPPLYPSTAPFNCAINNNNTNDFTAKTRSSSDDEEDGDLRPPKATGSPWPTPLTLQQEVRNQSESVPVRPTSSSSSYHQGHYATKAQLKCGPYQPQLAAAAAASHHQGYHSLSPSNSTIVVTVMQASATLSSSSPSSAMAVADGSDALGSPVWRPW